MNNTKNYTRSVKIKSVQLAAVAAVLITFFFLTSCSSIQTMLVNNTATEGSPSAEASYSPQPGGELFIAVPDDIESYDPLLARNEDLINMLSLVYETPLTVDAGGRVQPGLVETWQSDETGAVFTFSFRRGIVFHNGDPFSAEDVFETIMDILALDGTNGTTAASGDQASASPDASEENSSASPDAGEVEGSASPDASVSTENTNFISRWISSGDTAENTGTGQETEDGQPTASPTETGTTQAAEESVNRYTIYNKEIDSVTLVDENTLELKMKKPGRDALYFMTFPVRPKDDSDFSTPVGTGPYAVQEMGDAITLGVNDGWWKKAPYIKSIVAKPISIQDNKMETYESGLLDFVTTGDISANKLKAQGKTQTVDYMTNYYDCLIPNLFDSTMKNDDVRKAISYAIDRRDVISNVLLNHAVAAEMPVSPGFFAFNNKYNLYEIDKNMAKQLLAKAGYSISAGSDNGSLSAGSTLNISIIVPKIIGQEYRVEAAREIAKQLGEIGINCKVEELSLEEYSMRLKAGDFSLAYTSYYLDQNMDLTFMFQPDSESNFGHVASDELMGYIDACNKAINEKDIITAYENLEQYFMDKVPQIGLYYRMHSIITDDSVKGISKPYENHIFGEISAWSMEQND